MTYYDPLYPALTNTRYEIQKSINILQQKLNKRNHFDYQPILNTRTNYQPLPSYPSSIPNSEFQSRKYMEDQLINQKLKYFRDQADLRYKHLNRIDVFQRQRYQLSRQKYMSTQQRRMRVLEDDQTLIRKYQDGTKIKQYNHELESYPNTNRYQPINPITRSIPAEFKLSTENKLKIDEKKSQPILIDQRSPYNKLIASEQKQKNQIRKKPKTASKLNKTNKRKTQRKQVKKQKKQNIFSERPGINPLQKHALKSKDSSNKGIQNRLKLSEIVYEDARFKNIKHEESHLLMTYDNELKVRKEMKEKLNNHPLILKKHAMVVQ